MEMITKDGILVCPSCEGEYLHHDNITVFTRDCEDGTSKVHSIHGVPLNQAYKRPKQPSDNPSPRRNGVLIDFDCEQCDGEPTLAIYQHKGNTIVEWYSVRETKRVSIR